MTTSAVQTGNFTEGEIQAAILDNFFSHQSTGADTAASSTRLFQTSSDTVNQLLRGLNTRTQSESIQRLSRETASVLPTFARALESSVDFQTATIRDDSGATGESIGDGQRVGRGGREEEEEGDVGGEDGSGTADYDEDRTPTPLSGTCTCVQYMWYGEAAEDRIRTHVPVLVYQLSHQGSSAD